MMTPLAYTDEQQIDELLYEIRTEDDDIEALEIFASLDDLLASIRHNS